MTKKINIKIYGITTVGTKGQIIIPKECREDFEINSLDEFLILSFGEIAFGIGKEDFKKMKIKANNEIYKTKIFGKIKIGTKFQFVIPSGIRRKLNIKPSDNLVIIGKNNFSRRGIGFLKNDNIDYLLDYLKYVTT